MKKAIALIALSLSLEAAFLFQIAAPARPVTASATQGTLARSSAPRASRG